MGWLPEPQPSLVGVALVVASAVVMSVLYVGKMRIAARVQSRSLRAEAMETLFCDLQDLTILVGLALNSLLAWWWADPVAALFLVPFFLKEGRENLQGHDDEDGDHGPQVCFCRGCFGCFASAVSRGCASAGRRAARRRGWVRAATRAAGRRAART